MTLLLQLASIDALGGRLLSHSESFLAVTIATGKAICL